MVREKGTRRGTIRKRGVVSRLVVEIDINQLQQLEVLTTKLGISKADAVAAALNIWSNMVSPPIKEGG